MSIDLDTVMDSELGQSYGIPSTQQETKEPTFNENIFSSPNTFKFSRQATLENSSAEPEKKTSEIFMEKVARSHKPHQIGGSVEVGVTAEWGGKNGLKFEGYGQGEIRDNRGNFAQANVQIKNDGCGKANASGGCRKEIGNK